MPKNPNAKGAKKKELAQRVKVRTEAKYAARSASNGSSKTNHSRGMAVPVHKLEQMKTDTLRVIVETKQPGWLQAQNVLVKRQEQADRQRALRQQNFQPAATA
jgi:hypothetical protein